MAAVLVGLKVIVLFTVWIRVKLKLRLSYT